MAITSTGFGSGLPINDLVSQLVNAEAAPATNRLDRREMKLQTELSAIGILKGALADFRSGLTKLADADNFTSRTARSSDSAIATISAEQTASLGSYDLQVERLASAQKLVGLSDYTEGVTGDLTFTNGKGDSFTASIGEGAATLEGVRDAINDAENNFGVTATILNVNGEKRLVLTADETGADNAITSISSTTSNSVDVEGVPQTLAVFDYSDLDGSNFDQVKEGLDALFSIEGQAMTSASNTIEDVIPGATITLKGETEEFSSISLTVGTNTSGVKSMIEGFVKSYNELQGLIAQQTAYNQDTGRSGALQGDALTRTVQNQLRGMLSGSGNGEGIGSLAELGITTERNGQLSIDSDKLNDALNNRFDQVTSFFSDEDTGFAKRMDDTLNNYLKFDGTFASRTDSINRQMDEIGDQRESLNMRLEKLETRLFSQFNAMDAIVAQLNNTGDYLQQQLAGLANIGKSDK